MAQARSGEHHLSPVAGERYWGAGAEWSRPRSPRDVEGQGRKVTRSTKKIPAKPYKRLCRLWLGYGNGYCRNVAAVDTGGLLLCRKHGEERFIRFEQQGGRELVAYLRWRGVLPNGEQP